MSCWILDCMINRCLLKLHEFFTKNCTRTLEAAHTALVVDDVHDIRADCVRCETEAGTRLSMSACTSGFVGRVPVERRREENARLELKSAPEIWVMCEPGQTIG
jgi:hypothetical protein